VGLFINKEVSLLYENGQGKSRLSVFPPVLRSDAGSGCCNLCVHFRSGRSIVFGGHKVGNSGREAVPEAQVCGTFVRAGNARFTKRELQTRLWFTWIERPSVCAHQGTDPCKPWCVNAASYVQRDGKGKRVMEQAALEGAADDSRFCKETY